MILIHSSIKFEAEIDHRPIDKVLGSGYPSYPLSPHVSHMDVRLQIPAFVSAPEPVFPSTFEHEIHAIKHSVVADAHYVVERVIWADHDGVGCAFIPSVSRTALSIGVVQLNGVDTLSSSTSDLNQVS